jgi:hypothetical protein
MGARFDFVSFIAPGYRLPFAIASDVCGDLLRDPGRILSQNRLVKNDHQQNGSYQQSDRPTHGRPWFTKTIPPAEKYDCLDKEPRRQCLYRRKFDHLPPLGILVNPQQALFNDTIVKVLQRLRIRVFMFVAGLARVGNLWIFHRVLG